MISYLIQCLSNTVLAVHENEQPHLSAMITPHTYGPTSQFKLETRHAQDEEESGLVCENYEAGRLRLRCWFLHLFRYVLG